MLLSELRKISRPHWLEILIHVKRSTGLSVSELAKALRMSYMGVKQHCQDLEKKGFLDTWRRPKEVGR
ncbi:MAG: MarR family transcriptional regulator, partial [Verrucomicrobiota bacterium]